MPSGGPSIDQPVKSLPLNKSRKGAGSPAIATATATHATLAHATTRDTQAA